ncbi:MAG TPA: helix-turn-helix domain-containing protein [Acidimicrobiales bacterium]|nr:helix-turn-helix domain-containing protein [Acidimicrobiales bacterium]
MPTGPAVDADDDGAVQVARLRRADRRTALLDAAVEIAVDYGTEAVSMETVATRARVSRPLVYKHFANAGELLAAAYRREASALDDEIVAVVSQARGSGGMEATIRSLVRAIIDGAESRGSVLTQFIRAGGRDGEARHEQRARDRRTVRYFTKLAVEEFQLGEREAQAATRVLLSGIDSLLHQWRERPTREQRLFLEELYVGVVLGGLRQLAQHQPAG